MNAKCKLMTIVLLHPFANLHYWHAYYQICQLHRALHRLISTDPPLLGNTVRLQKTNMHHCPGKAVTIFKCPHHIAFLQSSDSEVIPAFCQFFQMIRKIIRPRILQHFSILHKLHVFKYLCIYAFSNCIYCIFHQSLTLRTHVMPFNF